MIPSFNASMVLPPYVGEDPTHRADMSPYKVTMREVALRFATSTHRARILRGLLSYRNALRGAGVSSGFQWLDGSFVEDVEQIRKLPPQDLDVVTFGKPPTENSLEKFKWLQEHLNLFVQSKTKESFLCDAFFVDLTQNPELLVDDSRYWFGLFSHQRESALWKGMLQVPLNSDDSDAIQYLDSAWPEKGSE